MEEKMATVYIYETPKRCAESDIPKLLANIEKVKEFYRERGVPEEMIEKYYSVRIVKDEEE